MAASGQFWAYFTLVGDFELASVTAQLGLSPTEGWTSCKSEEQKFNRWSLESRLDETASVSEQIKDVLSQLAPHYNEVLSLRRKFEGWMQVVGHFYSEVSSLRIDQHVMNECSLLQLSIDIDFVYFNELKQEGLQ